MGKRYIEVFASKYSEMEWVVTRMAGGEGDGEAVVRLRGLPYGAQKQDIAEFFAGRLKFCDSLSKFLDASLNSYLSPCCVFSSHASNEYGNPGAIVTHLILFVSCLHFLIPKFKTNIFSLQYVAEI